MRDVAVLGIGQTKFGELWDKSLRDLFAEASLQAIDEASVQPQAIYVANAGGGLYNGQQHLGALLADHIGLSSLEAIRIEAADASGGVALRQGWAAVAGGLADYVLVTGVEKMTDLESDYQGYVQTTFTDQDVEGFSGLNLTALYALVAHQHMAAFGTTREQIAAATVQAHAHARKNPLAQFNNAVKLESVLNAAALASPLRMLDGAPASDGAAAVLLGPLDGARKGRLPLVRIAGSGQAGDVIALHNRRTLTGFPAAERAAAAAYKQAGVSSNDIQVAEVHDAYSIALLIALEDLGFVARGQAGAAVAEGVAGMAGRIPTNPSGGLKAQGAPLGAIGVAQAVEIVRQLRGTASNQVANARLGLSHNVGGVGGTAVVHIFSKED